MSAIAPVVVNVLELYEAGFANSSRSESPAASEKNSSILGLTSRRILEKRIDFATVFEFWDFVD